MLIEDHTVALEAQVTALEVDLARQARELQALKTFTFALVQAMAAGVPMTRPDGRRVRLVVEVIDEGEPA